MNALEVATAGTAALMGGALTIAQISPPDASITDMLVKGGAVGVVGGLFWLFMRLHFKALKEMSDSHKEVSAAQAQEAKEAAAKVAEDTRKAMEFLVSGHKEAVDRIEQAHTHSADKFEQGTQKIVDSISSSTKRCAEMSSVLESVLREKKT